MPDDLPDEIAPKVLELLREVLPRKLASRELHEGLSLQRDLGMDSMALASIAFRFSEEFDVDLSELADEIARLRTVGDVLKIASTLLGSSRAGSGGASP